MVGAEGLGRALAPRCPDSHSFFLASASEPEDPHFITLRGVPPAAGEATGAPREQGWWNLDWGEAGMPLLVVV